MPTLRKENTNSMVETVKIILNNYLEFYELVKVYIKRNTLLSNITFF